MFFLVMSYTTILIMVLESLRLKSTKVNYFLASSPAIIFYVFVSSSQYFVGSDYPSYIFIYENPWVWDRYFEQGEYFFYYALTVLNFFEFPPQSLFFIFSLVQSIPIFIIIFKLKSKHSEMKSWLLFLLFFTVTNVYNNQLNGIRQYAAVVLVPLFVYAISERQNIKSILLLILMKIMHSSSIICIFIYPLKFFTRVGSKFLFFVFCFSFFIYAALPSVIPSLLELLDSGYSRYAGGVYFEGSSINIILTKVYYIPIYILFFYLYSPGGNETKSVFFNSEFFKLGIVIFSFTFWIFIMSLEIKILSRLQAYFVFFNILPIYYVLDYFYRRNLYVFLIVFSFVLLPYVAKITFLAKNEFYYQSVIFN